jgi:phosphatidylethanolamine-binding protein (PEBP) family uncharacterized protein
MGIRKLIVVILGAGLAGTAWLAGAVSAGAVSSTIPVSIASSMTLSTSTVEVEFPVTVTCDNIGAYDSYVYVHLQQDQTGATASGEVRPLICDSAPHQYLVHVFADSRTFHDSSATASAVAQNIAQNFVQQSGSATASTTLAFGRVDVPAVSVTSPNTGSQYTVDIGHKASLSSKLVNAAGYLEAQIALTVTCSPPTSSQSPWLSVDLEAPNGQGVVTGSNSNSNVQNPTLVCDSAPHTYTFPVFAQSTATSPGGFTSGAASAAVYIESSYATPQWPTAPVNANAVATIHLA